MYHQLASITIKFPVSYFPIIRKLNPVRMRTIMFALALVYFPVISFAQFLPFSLGGGAYFNRQLDALRWQYDGNILLSEGDFSLELDNEFRSRLYLTDGKPQNIQDENQIRLSMQQWLNTHWALTGEAESYSFTTTNLRQNMGHAGILFSPYKDIKLSLMGGILSDRRSDHLDQGISGLFRARSRPIQTGDFVIHPSADAQYARISPREYSNLNFLTRSRYQLDELIIRTDLFHSRGRRESYQPSSFFNRGLTNIIESIKNDTTGLNLQVQAPITESIGFTIDLSTLNNLRTVESRPFAEELVDPIFDTQTRRNENQLRAYADYEFQRNRLAAGINFVYINRSSKLINIGDYPEDQITRRNEVLRNSNFDQSRFEAFTQTGIRLSNDHELHVRAQSGIMRYDTPVINQDDRDELNHMIDLTSRHIFSPYFDLTINTGGEATHYVYLSGVRSIENNWRRTIRLSPQIHWQPHDRMEMWNTFLVRANYTVEDYQLEGRLKNDQASREYAMRSDIDFTLSQYWKIETGLSRSELRIGRLHWDSFQETPTDTLITYDIQAMIVRQNGRHRIGFGGRYFLRRDYLPQAIITTEIETVDGLRTIQSIPSPGLQITRQLGPSVDINIGFLSGNTLVISGWLQRQRVYRRLYTTYPDELAEAFKQEERRPSLRIYPNLEIRAVFVF